MKKLPSVFANNLSDIQNNKTVFYSSDDRNTIKQPEEKKLIGKTVEQKISEIFNSTSYIYKAEVEIVLDSGTVTKKIIGRNRRNLITIDNEVIAIDSIKDINYK